jgi:hypothetical protein
MKVWEDAFAAGVAPDFKPGFWGPLLGGKAFRRTFPRRKASAISSLIHIAPFPLTLGDGFPLKNSRIELLNRSSRRKEAPTSSMANSLSLLTSAATVQGEARSPLGRKTHCRMDESRMRFPRRQQSCFLLPEGEGQDEGEGGAPWPNRALPYEPAFPIHQSTNPIIPFPVFPCND